MEEKKEKLMDLSTAATVLGVSYSTARRHLLNGELRGVRIGTTQGLRVYDSSVRELIKRREIIQV
ncbi:MAG: helix-turn-helix domain-containing protein [Proteobacteria bacterium]|nr:helix-turn-helix domain-containing protein [Pseudomonadota bacterium]